MRPSLVRAAIVACIGLIGHQIGPGPCRAGLVTVSFEGRINGLFGDYASLSPDLVFGEAFSGGLIYDDSKPGEFFGSNHGSYASAVVNMWFHVGGTTFTSFGASALFPDPDNTIDLENDAPALGSSDLKDSFAARVGSTSNANPAFYAFASMSAYFASTEAAPTALTSTALTDASSIFPSDAQTRVISYSVKTAADAAVKGFQGEIESVRLGPAAAVPEPSSLVLAGSGLAGLVFWRRVRRGRVRP